MVLLRVAALLTCLATGTSASVVDSHNTFSFRNKNTLLDDQLCQVYYNMSGDCSVLRQQIRSNIRGSGVPTLELGSFSKPVMFFIHGWPDTAAVWANQFESFCLGQTAKFFCVAPSWIDYHPDYPRHANTSTLLLRTQRAYFHSVIVEMKLKDITLVIFDWGSLIGYQYAWEHPELVKQVISFNLGMSIRPPRVPQELLLGSLPLYQQIIINAFRTDNDTLITLNIANSPTNVPCHGCRIAPGASGVGGRTGWPYAQIVSPSDNAGWISELVPANVIPIEDWQFSWVPSFPRKVPLLFLYSDHTFAPPDFCAWVNRRGDGSKSLKMNGSDHWIPMRVAEETNRVIADWACSQNPGDVFCAYSGLTSSAAGPNLNLFLLGCLIFYSWCKT